ncbi:apolipoprotein N-acyltransferase [Streptomyces sp. TRM49041]|uniref:apolipoprotein N-acyltransferase n=1 Tax=Streptomyces sp. TRM49041 TaxID=2603216 RepID=UPI0011F06E83|nr:apolipoprotein N-acyltransferase [Streptomyces sp. TRM49041]
MRLRAGRGEVAEWLSASRWGRGAAAVVAGALPALAFPEPSLWWLAYVALVPWLLLIRTAPSGRRAALDGWLGGLGFMLAVHHWLMPNLHVFILLLAGLLGLLWAPWGWLVRWALGGGTAGMSRGRAVTACLVVPSAWLMVEVVRSWENLGGPWGLLGASQWQVTPALRMAALGGVWLVTLLVVAVNTAVALLVAVPPVRTAAVGALVVCAVAVGSVWAWVTPPEPVGRVRVAVVQPGVISGAEQRFARGEELTRPLAGRGVDLVVWGESSVGADLTARPDLSERLAALSADVGAELLVNVDARRSDKPGIYKSSVLVGPDGLTGDRYDKMRLVPFGEYIPARSVLGWVTAVGQAADEDRRRGAEQVVMTAGTGGGRDLRLGPLVCFETAFPDMSRRLVRDGAELLIAQSSTSTFQDSWAPEQHASLAALRSAETGRPMVHATLTGESAVYGPDGARIGTPLGTDRSAAAVYDVPLTTASTPYVQVGDWPLWAASAVLAGVAVTAGFRAVRRRPAPGSPVRPARTVRGSTGRRGH